MSKCLAQKVCQTAGLEDHVTNIRIKRVLGVGVVVSPVSVSAWFDNSEQNPFNPDPKVEVRWGPYAVDEMAIGWADFIDDELPQG